MKTKRILNYILILTFLISSLIFVQPIQAATGKYHIKVNRLANTVTVYERQNDGSYKPIKAMLCSSGGYLTPLGTYKTQVKYRWRSLFYNAYGQYATRIVGNVLFHSVPFYKPNPDTLMRGQFEMLGSVASHGCVRLSTADAKWIYDNCSYGTKVTVYASKDPGPLGKPEATPYPKYTGYDPTDIWSLGIPEPQTVATPPVITAPKKITLSKTDYSYDLLKGVKATSYDGKDITNDIEIEDNIDFETSGRYTVKYTITDKNGNTASASTVAIIK